MVLYLHELRQGRTSLIVWAAAIAFLLVVCVALYPQMSSQIDEVSSMFADMGSFTAAFGMDRVNFGKFLGYFAIE